MKDNYKHGVVRVNKTISELLEYWTEYLEFKKDLFTKSNGHIRTDQTGVTYKWTENSFEDYINWIIKTKLKATK